MPDLYLHLGIVNKLLNHLNSEWPHVFEWCEIKKNLSKHLEVHYLGIWKFLHI